MEKIIQNIIERKLTDFSGARVMGQVSLSDELVNEVLQLSVKEVMSMTNEVARPDDEPKAATPASPDLNMILSHLKVEKLHYRTTPGQTIIELSAGLE